MKRATALIAEDDPQMLKALRRILIQFGELDVETAVDGEAAWARARELKPELIVSDYEMPGMNGFDFCRRVKADPELKHTMFIVLTGYDDTAMKVTGLNLGVDDYLTKPVDVPEFLAKLRATMRVKRLQDQLRDDNVELERLRAGLEQSFDRLLHVLYFMLDLRIPGANERSERLVDRATELAQRMEIPSEFHDDLALAARLHEVGKLVEREPTVPVDGTDWDYLVASEAILDSVETLRGAAEVVYAIGEHWDGSGGPRHLLHGQIPLRSRILRVLIDLFAACEGEDEPVEPATAFARVLQPYANTRYDPLVLSHLHEMLDSAERSAWVPNKRRIPVTQLQGGMVLAEDLFTGSGVKLLGEGAVVTDPILDSIIRRHAHDPILYGAWVQR